jgi:excisionase family DNA binding protein
MSHIQPQSTGRRCAWTINEFCQIVGVSRSGVYKMVNKGLIRTAVVAGRRLIPDSERQRLLEGDFTMSPIRESHFTKRRRETASGNKAAPP